MSKKSDVMLRKINKIGSKIKTERQYSDIPEKADAEHKLDEAASKVKKEGINDA